MMKMRVKREKPDYVEYENDEEEESELDDEGQDIDEEEFREEEKQENRIDVSNYLSVEQIKKESQEENEERKMNSDVNIDRRLAAHRPPRPPPPEPNRSSDNLDFNIVITRTTRGHDQLLYEGYTYLKTTQQPRGDIARWKCTSYYKTKTNCTAKLFTTMDGLCVLLDSKTEHNHPPPDEKKLKIILFREQVKQIANNHPEMKPTEILTNARMLLDTPMSLGLKDESIMRYIQRVKSKNRQQQQELERQQQHNEMMESHVEEATEEEKFAKQRQQSELMQQRQQELMTASNS